MLRPLIFSTPSARHVHHVHQFHHVLGQVALVELVEFVGPASTPPPYKLNQIHRASSLSPAPNTRNSTDSALGWWRWRSWWSLRWVGGGGRPWGGDQGGGQMEVVGLVEMVSLAELVEWRPPVNSTNSIPWSWWSR